ncbi:hypothetical protein TKK_0008656 [Trichogramma kaykai]
MDMESLYDYAEEEHNFYEASQVAPGAHKGYPIDHRPLKRNVHFSLGHLGYAAGDMTEVAKYMKQELPSDAEEEGCVVPSYTGRMTGSFAMRKVPSLSDLSDPESSLVGAGTGDDRFTEAHYVETY